MSKTVAFFVLVVILVVIDALVGDNIVGNFFLGMISVGITRYSVERFDSDAVEAAASIGFGILLVPYFLYLLWYALFGAYTVPSEVATNYLVSYVTDNFLTSIPSTLIGAIGTAVIEGFVDVF